MKEIIESDLKRRDDNIRKTTNYLKKLPEENLIFDICHGYPRYRIRKNGRIITLGKKKDEALINNLVIRKVLESRVHDDLIFKKLDEAYLNMLKNEPLYYEESLHKHPEIEKIFHERFGLDKAAQESMLAEHITADPIFKQHLIYHTSDGSLVRSKSEVMIYDALLKNDFVFMYERPFEINGGLYFPDFSIIHRRTRDIVLWEHLGQLEDEEYKMKNRKKIINYMNAGYFPGVNLIITWENENNIFDIRKIDQVINLYLK